MSLGYPSIGMPSPLRAVCFLGFQGPGHLPLPVRSETGQRPRCPWCSDTTQKGLPGNTNCRAMVPVAGTAQTGRDQPAPSAQSLGAKLLQGMFWVVQGQDVGFSLWRTRRLMNYFYARIYDSVSDH